MNERCHVCWNLLQCCSCVEDALAAQMPRRCTECFNFIEYCSCVERSPLSLVEALAQLFVRIEDEWHQPWQYRIGYWHELYHELHTRNQQGVAPI